MNREQLEHALRAASAITGERVMFVIGSQSIHGAYGDRDLPFPVTKSQEVDIGFFDDPNGDKADMVEAMIGELTAFHESFNFYVDGVDLTTATLPDGWIDRLVDVSNANTNGAVGRCLDPHDCAVSKMAAGREKDWEFVFALLDARLLSSDVLLERMDATDMHPAVRDRAVGLLMGRYPPNWLR